MGTPVVLDSLCGHRCKQVTKGTYRQLSISAWQYTRSERSSRTFHVDEDHHETSLFRDVLHHMYILVV